MKNLLFATSIIVVLLATGCTNKTVKLSSQLVTNFVEAYQDDNFTDALDLYPNILEFKNFSTYKIDSISILKVILPNLEQSSDTVTPQITVETKTYFQNGFGKRYERDLSFFIEQLADDKFVITDTKGLIHIDTDDVIYQFSILYNSLEMQNVSSDLGYIKRYNDSSITYDIFKTFALENFKNNITVSDWYWQTSDYSYSATGGGVVTNKSDVTLTGVKYEITYKDSKYNVITTDSGYLPGPIKPNSSKSFSFYTNYVGNASKASIEIVFPDDLIDKTIANQYNN